MLIAADTKNAEHELFNDFTAITYMRFAELNAARALCLYHNILCKCVKLRDRIIRIIFVIIWKSSEQFMDAISAVARSPTRPGFLIIIYGKIFPTEMKLI